MMQRQSILRWIIMQLWKFKILALVLSTFLSSRLLAFSDKECLIDEFETRISHPAFPMGLTETVLGAKKKECKITVTHKKLKFIKKKWEIDICRAPIHIKSIGSSVEVFKKENHCENDSKDAFCSKVSKIKRLLEDDGLIFADGKKELLENDHGRIYCSYILVRHYLEKNQIFSLDEDVIELTRFLPGVLSVKPVKERKKAQKKDKVQVEVKKRSEEKKIEKETNKSSREFEVSPEDDSSGSGGF